MDPLASQDLARFPPLFGAVAGVVLAGGRSTRMGRDKALLCLDGESLIRRQLRLLRESGVNRLMVALAAGSLNNAGPLLAEIPPDVECLEDSQADCGPVGGIAAALADLRPEESQLLALAVDLPRLGGWMLRQMIESARQTPECGVVPVLAGRMEPLVALYPRVGLDSLRERLSRGIFSVQDWVREGVQSGWMREFEVSRDEAPEFLNWNRPEDFPDAGV